MHRTLLVLAALVVAGSACAQATSSDPLPSTAPPAATPVACACVPAGTVVELEITQRINSFEHKRGDRFGLRLAEPVVVEGATVLPTGTPGVGEVVHAAAAKGGGKPGELLLAARYLEMPSGPVPLRGLKLGASGKSNAELALAVSFAAGPFAMFNRGREIEIPAGTRVHARLAQPVPLPAPPDASFTAPPSPQES